MTNPENSIAPTEEPDGLDLGQIVAHHTVGSRLRTYFLTGLVVAGPLAITIYLVWSFVTWVDDLVRPFMPAALRPENYLPVKVPGYGLIIAFLRSEERRVGKECKSQWWPVTERKV